MSITDIILYSSLDSRIHDSLQRKENLMEEVKNEIEHVQKNPCSKISEILYVGRYKKKMKVIDMDDLKEGYNAEDL